MTSNKAYSELFRLLDKSLVKPLINRNSFRIFVQAYSQERRKLFLFLLLLIFSQIVVSQNLNQSLIFDNGGPYTGVAKFKFLIHADSAVLWSNDGSCIEVFEPRNSFELLVTNGLYDACLGIPPMKPIFSELLQQYPNARICVWVDLGKGFNKLSDERFVYESVSITGESDIQYSETGKQRKVPILITSENNNKETEFIENENKESTNPEGYLVQWHLMHDDDKGNTPFDGLLKAKNQIEKMPPPKDAALWNWEWLGPGNIGGRIRTIAIKPDNPNIIFIGSASGGIWKSTNAGGSWSVVDDFLPNLAITTLTYDPTNMNIMYASTGEGYGNIDGLPGAGIFKSTNGGTSWSQLPSTNNLTFRVVTRLAHHNDSTGVLYATTRGPNNVFKTVDGGISWKTVLSPPFPTCDVKISPHDPAIVMVGTMGSVYRSEDYGNSWDMLSDNTVGIPSTTGRCEIAFSPGNENRIYMTMARDSGQIYRSDDKGYNWSLVNDGTYYMKSATNQGNYDQAIWVDPYDSDHIVVGGIAVYKSNNAGNTITKISHGSYYHNNSDANSAHNDQHTIVQHPNYNGISNSILYVGNDGGIQRIDDINTTTENSGWTNLAGTTLGITQFYGGAASADGSIICGGTQDNDQLRYHESGPWSGAGNWFQSETGDGGCAAIDFTNSDIQYSEYTNLQIEKSEDSGDTWAFSYSGITDADNPDNTLFISPFVMDPNNASTLIAGSISIWRTTDGAENWNPINSPLDGSPKCSAIDIAPGNSDLIWVGYSNGNVNFTTNGTNAAPVWTSIDDSPNPLPDRYVTDVTINPNNNQEVYITFGGYQPDNVWFSSDGGTSWENRSGTFPNNLPDLQVNTIKVHPHNSNWIYIGTDMGVFASEDKGLHWAVDPRYPTENNELPANVEVDELFWQSQDYLIAVTHGRGMYRALPLYKIYVDKNASPGGDGSQSAPFQTVIQAVNVAGPGSVISIESNTYNEPVILFTKRGIVKSTNGSSIIK